MVYCNILYWEDLFFLGERGFDYKGEEIPAVLPYMSHVLHTFITSLCAFVLIGCSPLTVGCFQDLFQAFCQKYSYRRLVSHHIYLSRYVYMSLGS